MDSLFFKPVTKYASDKECACGKLAIVIADQNRDCPTCGSEAPLCKDCLLDVAASALSILGLEAHFKIEGED